MPLSQRPSRSWGVVLGAIVVSGASGREAPVLPARATDFWHSGVGRKSAALRIANDADGVESVGHHAHMPCVFCGSTEPLTKEHVVSAWIASLFPDVLDADHVRRFEELDGSQEERNQWSGPPFAWTVRDVCAECNNGWMADLEGKPILTPLIKDQARPLSLPDMMVIATWATKTVLVAGLATPGERDTASAETYGWFGEHRQPLPGGVVWVARYSGDGQWPFSLHQHGGSFETRDGTRYRNFHAILAIGYLVLAVFGHEIPGDPPISGSSSRRRLLIWPSTDPVHWPPAESMTEAMLTAESAELPDPAS